MLLELDALGRFQAVQDYFQASARSGPNYWHIFLTVGAGLAAIALTIAAARYFSRRRGAEPGEPFVAACRKAGLTNEEQDLLSCVARLCGLRTPHEVFTVEAAFTKGLDALLASPRARGMSEQGRLYMASLADSLRDKLGFGRPADGVISSSRQISEGTRVTMFRGDQNQFEAIVAQNSSSELVVEPEVPVEFETGLAWTIRYCDGASMWEFDTVGNGRHEGMLLLAHSDNIRFINRRRYERTAIRRPAAVAIFDFLPDDSSPVLPAFESAQLVEIAGPGVRLVSPLVAQAGQRALVILHLQGEPVQAVGRVRRVDPQAGGEFSIAVELAGLTHTEMAELSRQASMAVQAAEQPAMRESSHMRATLLPADRPAQRRQELAHVN